MEDGVASRERVCEVEGVWQIERGRGKQRGVWYVCTGTSVLCR